MIPLAIARRTRDAAPVHARLRVVAIEPLPPDFEGGACRVTLAADSVFRGGDQLSQGQMLTLELHFYLPSDGPPTGLGWLDFGTLRVGAAFEAFLDRTADGGFVVPMFQIAPTTATGPAPDPALWNDELAPRPVGLPTRLFHQLRKLLTARRRN